MNFYREYTPVIDPKYCFVPTCHNSSRDVKKRFFAVPNSAKRDWCIALSVTCPKRVLYICEDHLNLEEDVENYLYWKTMKGRPRLQRSLPKSLQGTPTPQDMKCQSSQDTKCQDMIESIPSTSMDKRRPRKSKNGLRPNKLMIKPIPSIPSISKQNFSATHRGLQVKSKTSDEKIHCVLNKIVSSSKKAIERVENTTTDEVMPSTYGSSYSVDTSEVSSQVYVKAKNQGADFMLAIIKKRPQSYIGVPKNYYWVINYLGAKLNLDTVDIIITLYKIKNNTPFYQISDMFTVSLTTLWRTFFKTLSVLSKFFKELIFCPNFIDIKRNFPPSFKTNKDYANVYCIISSFEIQNKKPADPVTQPHMSQDKNTNTLKYLLATSPDGFVIFISAGFGGHISDVDIIENSGFLDILPPNCTILAESEKFKYVDSLLNKKQIKLLHLPSVSNDIKMTKQETIKSNVILSLKIHVERVIRRIRLFKFFNPHSGINNKLIQYADEMAIVACGLINLHSPIIKLK